MYYGRVDVADAVVDYYDGEYGHDGADALGTACRDALAGIDAKERNALDALLSESQSPVPRSFQGSLPTIDAMVSCHH